MRRGRGLFVTLEGIEGAGKSTQARRLARALEAAGCRVVSTREPGGGTPLGEALRALLKDPAIWRELGLAEIYLYAAARCHHLETLVLPALERGEVVVCDRYLDSTRVYQGTGRGRSPQLIEQLHALPPLTLRPDRTLLLDLPVEEGLARARQRLDEAPSGYDEEDVLFFRRVRDGFLEIARSEPERVRVIDASGPEPAVHARLVAGLADLVPGLAPVEGDR
ncbi:MAG: dTMP kinase [Acidobacteria bacterium]|jgi:dTMP kinase|nr:dTMP kinase [Acidobacteriota bacterium]